MKALQAVNPTHHEQQVVCDVAGRASDGNLDRLLPGAGQVGVLLQEASKQRCGQQRSYCSSITAAAP